MRTALLTAAFLFATIAQPVASQTVFRCQDANRLTYSDRPCGNGTERHVVLDRSPATDVLAASREHLEQQLAVRAARAKEPRERNGTRTAASLEPTSATCAIRTDERSSTTTISYAVPRH